MMTHDEFKNKVLGTFVEVGGSANAINQCVDLANAYRRDVLGLPIILGTNAIDFPKKKTDKEEYILNSPTAIPIKGDQLIFSSPDGIGHISVNDEANIDTATSIDQNWPVGSKCKMVTHKYITSTYKIVGWLRSKVAPINNSDPDMTEQEKIILEFVRVNKITEGQLREGYGYVKDGTVTNLNKKIGELDKALKDLQIQLDELSGKFKEYQKTAEQWQLDLETANQTISNQNKDLETYKPYKALYENKCKETVDKYTAFELLQMGLKKLLSK